MFFFVLFCCVVFPCFSIGGRDILLGCCVWRFISLFVKGNVALIASYGGEVSNSNFLI